MSARYKPIDNHHAAHPKKQFRKNINSRWEKNSGILLTKTTVNIPGLASEGNLLLTYFTGE